MSGCFLFVVGIIVGVVAIVALQTLVLLPTPPTQAATNGSDLVIVFHNQFLAREIQAQLDQSGGPASLQGITVQTAEGQSIVLAGTAVATGTPLKVPVRLTLRPTAVQNRVTIQIVQAQLGGLKLPGSLFSSFEGAINQALNKALANQKYRVVGVRTTVDGIVVDVSLT